MNNYLVLCNFARCGVELNNKLFTSQWTVGSFDTIEECYEASKQDALQFALDNYKDMYSEDAKEAFSDKVDGFMDKLVNLDFKETDLLFFERDLISYIEYTDASGTHQNTLGNEKFYVPMIMAEIRKHFM